MANIHTNYLTGNDTTGDGSTSLPYKTVFKALAVASSSDFIKVAGGQWSSALAGDFTFTLNSNTVSTSVSQVGVVLVDDILSFEDGQFGFDKFHLKVTAVTAATITMAMWWAGPTITTNTVKRIETYHYSSSSAGGSFETQVDNSVQPGGRTGITISGGWSTDYTVQNGWTVMRRTGGNQSVVNGIAGFTFISNGLGAWGTNLIWDRFLSHTQTSLFNMGSGTNPSSFAVKELAMVRGSFFQISNAMGVGIFQADPLVPSKFYINNPNTTNATQYINASITALTSQPEVFECDIWATLSFFGTVNSNNAEVAGIGMFSRIGQEGSKNQMNLHVRQNVYTAGSVPANPCTFAWLGNGGIYVKKLNYYMNEPQPVPLRFSQANQTIQIEDIELYGSGAAKSGLYNTLDLFPGQMIIDLSAEEKTIDSFKPGLGTIAANAASYEATLNKLCQSNLSPVQVTDDDGLKTMDVFGNIYFKNNGDLKISSGSSYNTAAGSLYSYKMIGVIEKPTAEFTVTFTLKVDTGAEAKWDTLAVQYGPNVNQIVTQALTPTDDYDTYTITIDPGDYSDWNKFKFPIYFGIRAKTANTFLEETMTYAYIQYVSIS